MMIFHFDKIFVNMTHIKEGHVPLRSFCKRRFVVGCVIYLSYHLDPNILKSIITATAICTQKIQKK